MIALRKYLYRQLFRGIERNGRLTLLNRVLVFVILLAVCASALSTERSLPTAWHHLLVYCEMAFGAIFFLEYAARIFAAAHKPGPHSAWKKRWDFIKSPLAIIDLLVIISTFIPMITADAAMLRILRLMRVMVILKFSRAIEELWDAMAERSDDLLVTAGLTIALLMFGATALYVVEGHIQPDKFGSIPRALWWAVITLTTVGYGDVAPVTALGKVIAGFIALSGIALVAMPTGIIAAAFSDAMQRRRDKQIDELQRHMEEQDETDRHLAAQLADLEKKQNSR